MEVFGSSGTRGIANEELTPEFVVRIAKAAGTVWGTDRVALARDTRTTGQMLADAAASGLASVGFDIDRLGIAPTPGLQAYAATEGIAAMMITASHNPPEYNGVKLVGADGTELTISELERIESVLLEEAFDRATWDGVGRTNRIDGANRRYVQSLLEAVDRDRIDAADVTVAIDPGHGAGSLTSPRFFRELGCGIVTVNDHPDGRFPGRDPEPIRENLGALRRLVRTTDADIGIAHDGDADRAIFVDERGEYVEGDAALAALAAAELEPGDVTVSAVNVSQRLVDVVHERDARLELTPIGSTRIMTRIRALHTEGERVPIAGEGNGGIVFPDYRLARDGAYTAARFLELLARQERRVSGVIAEHDGYHNVRTDIPYDSVRERDAMLDAAAAYAESADAEVTTTDGYRLDYGDAWVLARASGTEPLVRIYAEGPTVERAGALADGIAAALSAAEAA